MKSLTIRVELLCQSLNTTKFWVYTVDNLYRKVCIFLTNPLYSTVHSENSAAYHNRSIARADYRSGSRTVANLTVGKLQLNVMNLIQSQNDSNVFIAKKVAVSAFQRIN